MNRLFISLGLVLSVCLFAGGYWLGSRKAPLETTVYKDRVVVQHSQKMDDIVTVKEQKVTKPDGTVVESKTTLVDKSVEEHSQSEREVSLEVTKPVTNQPNWRISVLMPPRYPTSYTDLHIEVSRRVLGPVSVSVQASLKGEVLVGLGVDF